MSIGQKVGYIRVSTSGQNVHRQTSDLESYHVNELFIEYASGKSLDRPQLEAAMKYVRKGDSFIVHSMDRLARNLTDLLKIVNELTQRQVSVHFLKENIIFNGDDSPMSRLLLSVMGAFSEFERTLIRERQREGIEIAKAKGKFKGRKPSLTNADILELKKAHQEHKCLSKTELAKRFGISRPSLYKYLR